MCCAVEICSNARRKRGKGIDGDVTYEVAAKYEANFINH